MNKLLSILIATLFLITSTGCQTEYGQSTPSPSPTPTLVTSPSPSPTVKPLPSPTPTPTPEPTITMYAPDGRTMSVPQSEIEANKAVGWYTEPVVKMYSADGRTIYVGESEVDAYKKVNWYTEPYTPPRNTSSSGNNSSSNNTARYGSTVYVTPKGKRYHYSSSCAGKNATAKSLSDAKASGRTACKKCAQ